MYLSLLNNRNSLFNEFDRYFNDNSFFSLIGNTEIEEKDGVQILNISMPGFKQSDLDVSVDNGIIHIKAKNKKGRSYDYSATIGHFYDPDKMEAKMEDGILEIKLAKKEKTCGRKIPIK